jgi:hypothetical protein
VLDGIEIFEEERENGEKKWNNDWRSRTIERLFDSKKIDF